MQHKEKENEKKMKYEEQLQQIFANVNDWLKFAEAKNFGLLAVNAAVAFGFTQSTITNDSLKVAGYYIFVPFAIASMIPSLLSLFPILTAIESAPKNRSKRVISWLSNLISKEGIIINIHYYGYLKTLNKTTFESEFISRFTQHNAHSPEAGTSPPQESGAPKINSKPSNFTGYEIDLVEQILYNSRITYLKYQLFKIGATLFLLGGIFFIAVSFLMMLLCDKVCMC